MSEILKGTHIEDKVKDLNTVEFIEFDFDKQIKQQVIENGVAVVPKPEKPKKPEVTKKSYQEFLGLLFLDDELLDTIRNTIIENIDKVRGTNWNNSVSTLKKLNQDSYKLSVSTTKAANKKDVNNIENELKEYEKLKNNYDENYEKYEKYKKEYNFYYDEIQKIKRSLNSVRNNLEKLKKSFKDYLEISDKSVEEVYKTFNKHFNCDSKLTLDKKVIDLLFIEKHFYIKKLKATTQDKKDETEE